MLRVKLESANNELERMNLHLLSFLSISHRLVKQTMIQSGIDNANQLNVNGQKAIEELEKIKQVSIRSIFSPPGFTIDCLGTCTKVKRL